MLLEIKEKYFDKGLRHLLADEYICVGTIMGRLTHSPSVLVLLDLFSPSHNPFIPFIGLEVQASTARLKNSCVFPVWHAKSQTLNFLLIYLSGSEAIVTKKIISFFWLVRRNVNNCLDCFVPKYILTGKLEIYVYTFVAREYSLKA
jgi:hypothetical protein